MRMPLLLLTLLMVVESSAQQPFDAEHWLQHFLDYGREYRRQLPSLECDESMILQRVKNGKVTWEVRIETTLREIRDETKTDEFKDNYSFKTVDGKPPKPHFRVPYFVHGGFANALSGATNRDCYDYRVASIENGATIQINVDSRANVSDSACQDLPRDLHKVVRVDAASGAVKHVERSMEQDFSDKHHDVPFLSVDFAPQILGNQTLWLPARFEASDAGKQGHQVAIYSNFHRFVGEVKILPDAPGPEVTP